MKILKKLTKYDISLCGLKTKVGQITFENTPEDDLNTFL